MSDLRSAGWKETTIQSGDVSLRVAAGAETGPPLLILHGVTRRWQDCLTLSPVLSPRWQVMALDFRGHGSSSRCPGHYLVRDHVQDAIAVVRSMFRQPGVLYGHSLGALVALGVAAEMPDLVRAIVLEDPPATSVLTDIRATAFHSLFLGLRSLAGTGRSVAETTRLLAEVPVGLEGKKVPLGRIRDATALRFSARCLQELDPEVLTPLIEGRWLVGYDVDNILGRVHCPALLLRGDENAGAMLPRIDASALVARLKDCTVIDLPGVGHLIHWLEAEKTARFVVGFLESL